MKRLSVFCGLLLAIPTVSFAQTTIGIGHGANESYHMHKVIVHFKEVIEANPACKIKVNLFPGAQMGDDRETIENVQEGLLDIAVPSMSVLGGWDKAFLLPELPYMFPNRAAAVKVFSSQNDYTKALAERAGKLDVQLLGFLENGVRQIGNNVRPITKLEDFSGIKLRVMQVDAHVKAFTALGASPIPMASQEAFTAIQQGVVDGLDNSLGHMVGLRFMEVIKYVSLTSHVYTPYAIVANKGLKKKVGDACFSEIEKEMTKLYPWQQAMLGDLEKGFIATMEKIGVKVNTVPDTELKRMQEKTQSVRDEYRKLVDADVYTALEKAMAQ